MISVLRSSWAARSILAVGCTVGWAAMMMAWSGCSSGSDAPSSSGANSGGGNGGAGASGGTGPGTTGSPNLTKDAAASGGNAGTVSLPATCAVPGNPGEFYALSAQNLAGDEVVPMCDFRNDVVLVVNTASFCGNTPQYAPLEAMYEKYASQGFYILGFPCNQFGGQEPGDAADISSFCTTEYHITFPMFTKSNVNPPDENPIYTWLKAQPGGAGDVDWNFAKFLVGRDGKFIKRWVAATQPTDPDVVAAVEAALAK